MGMATVSSLQYYFISMDLWEAFKGSLRRHFIGVDLPHTSSLSVSHPVSPSRGILPLSSMPPFCNVLEIHEFTFFELKLLQH